MQHSSIKKNGDQIFIDWDNEGKIGVDQNGKVWENIDTPTPLKSRILNNILPETPSDNGEFLKPLFDNIEEILKKHKP